MAVISKIFCMRRGLRSTMTSSKANTVLSSGENFLEIQGSTVGKSKVKMKMGDGSTAYKDLPYVLGDTSTDPISFNENASTNATTALGAVTTGATLDNIVAGLKKAVSLNTQSLTELNDDIEQKINNIDTSPFLTKEEAAKTYLTSKSIDLSGYYTKIETDAKLESYLTKNDLNNYYTKSQVDTLIKQQQIINNAISSDDINNRYTDNILEAITSSNIESWIAKYIYSNLDRFKNTISCGSKVTIQDGIYNAQWVVVGADTELNKGDMPLTKPHLSLIPVTNLGNGQMNDSYTSYGAYVGTKMYKETIPKIVAALQKVLGSHLLARRVKLANNIDSNGKSNGSAYYTVYANLMNERQVFGTSTSENSYDIGDDTTALPGFNKYKNMIYGSSYFWLRSVCDGNSFVLAASGGSVGYYHAGNSVGVRPLITIG